MVIFSFGLLFEGIEIMGSVMKPLASSPFFVDMMGKVSHIPVLGILLGAGMTLVYRAVPQRSRFCRILHLRPVRMV